MMAFTREFSNTEIMAMAGYQLDPGHSDLDNEQPMSVKVHDGLWDAVDLRCTLGDIRKAKRVAYAGLERDLVMGLLLGAAKRALNVLKAQGESVRPGNVLGALQEAITKAEALRP